MGLKSIAEGVKWEKHQDFKDQSISKFRSSLNSTCGKGKQNVVAGEVKAVANLAWVKLRNRGNDLISPGKSPL